jgi:hypothetical protein
MAMDPETLFATLLFCTSLLLRLALRPAPPSAPTDWLAALAHSLLFAFARRHTEFARFARRRRLDRWVPDENGAVTDGARSLARRLPDLIDEISLALPADYVTTFPRPLVHILAAFAHEALLVDLADDWSHLFGAPDRSVSDGTGAAAVVVGHSRPGDTRTRRISYTLRDFERCAANRRDDRDRRLDPVIRLAPRERFVLRIAYSALAQVGSAYAEPRRYAYLIDLRAACDPDADPIAWTRTVRNLELFLSAVRTMQDAKRVGVDHRHPVRVHLAPVQVVDGVVARNWSGAQFFRDERRGVSSLERHAREHGTFLFAHGLWPIDGVRLVPHAGTMFVALGDLEMDPTHDYFYLDLYMTSPDADLRARLQAHGS